MKKHNPIKILFLLLLMLSVSPAVLGQSWSTRDTKNTCTARHECSGAAVDGKIYLIGGRGEKAVEEYDPATNQWRTMSMPPLEMHHFQAVAHKGKIYVIGALSGRYPHEEPISHVYIFDPKTDTWDKSHEIPEERRRGAAGLVVKDDKFYLVAGIKDGHWADNRNYFDEYDPATGKWRTLPDLPRVRDHFQAVVVDNKLYAVGGRKSFAKEGHGFELTYAEVDVYDFKTNKWETLPAQHNLPTERAGSSTLAYDGGFVVIGGESASQVAAHNEVEYFEPGQGWKLLNRLEQGRHGFPLVEINGSLYVVAGSGNRGGGPELTSVEVMK
ncbi:MAG TPA: kelch repeat-containing protein [Cyclobacteriaceae bacterium]|nr:kelch repeat-containing protein [Cyclobacteriaceae bacterium]